MSRRMHRIAIVLDGGLFTMLALGERFGYVALTDQRNLENFTEYPAERFTVYPQGDLEIPKGSSKGIGTLDIEHLDIKVLQSTSESIQEDFIR